MTQIMFPLDKAHEALDEFLNDSTGSGRPGLTERWLADENGEPVAYLVPAGLRREMVNGYHQWLDSQEIREEAAAPEHGYKPWRHSPLAVEDRLLPIEPLHDPLARGMFRKSYDELDEQQKNAIMGTAIWCLLRVTLDQDGQGAVPILMAGHDGEEPGHPLRWQIAFATSVPGLYLRSTPAMFADEWAILTGSGYRLAAGWTDRDDAEAAVEALGRTLPRMDWMRVTRKSFTPKAKQAITAVLTRYAYFGLNEKAPEPEVTDEEIPAPEETAP